MSIERWLSSVCYVLVLLGLVGGLHWTGCSGPDQNEPDASLEQELPDIRCFNRKPGSPIVKRIEYLGQVPRQPYTLRFEIDWEDQTGDLEGGKYQFSIDGKAFEKASVPKKGFSGGAGRGSLTLTVPSAIIREKEKSTPKGQKIQFNVELILFDTWDTPSNTPLVVLEFQR